VKTASKHQKQPPPNVASDVFYIGNIRKNKENS